MKHFLKQSFTVFCLLLTLFLPAARSQQTSLKASPDNQQHTAHHTNAMTAMPHNYQWFTVPYRNTGEEATAANADYRQNPEAGLLLPGTPCDNCYELIGRRTETGKTFIKEGTTPGGGKDILQQTSAEPMHYHDAMGNWLTIKTQLSPDKAHTGVYAAYEQPVPISIHTDAADNFTAIGREESFKFNKGLELIYAGPDGSQVSLGKADWSNKTAGDDGVYVSNAWPGIDIEMYVMRGAIKTNFIINHALPAYAAGQLLVRDHLLLGAGLSLYAAGEKTHTGLLEIRNAAGEMKYAMSEASAAEKSNAKSTYRALAYYIGDNNVVDIALPGDFLNRAAASYPVIIDPLVSTLTAATINGSSYSPGWTSGCVYTNPADVPANCTVTDIQFTMEYTATGGADMYNGAFSLYMGTCRSPGPAAGGLSWTCLAFSAGTCTASPASAYSIFSDFSSCVPAPACASYPLNITMQLYQDYNATAACATDYVYGSQPFVITVIGHTVELASAGGAATASPATICSGSTSTLTAHAVNGVPPYSYLWSPGSVIGSPVTVSPTTTTVYTVTITDACGNTVDASATVNVIEVQPITGTTTFCIGTNGTLSDATAGGTWSSGNTVVATIGAATGALTTISAGTSIITYTAASGCQVFVTVTVTPVPGPISGNTAICMDATSILANAIPGGTWTSSNAAVATVGGATGIVSGISPGTADITYATGPGCYNTTVVTVNLRGPITGPLEICPANTTTLSNVVGGGMWTTANAAVATVSNAGVVTGQAPGTAVISYTVPSGCVSTVVVTVDAALPVTGSMSICEGATTGLANAYAGGTWASANTAVAAIDATTGVVSAVAGGTSRITYTTPLGCISYSIFTVNAIPAAPGTEKLDLCQMTMPVPLLTATGEAGSTLQWYNTSAGGIARTTAQPDVMGEGNTTWYVSQIVKGCESERAPLVVTVHHHQPSAIVTDRPSVCQHDTMRFAYGGPGFMNEQFSWSFPASATVVTGGTADSTLSARFDTSYALNYVVLTVGDGYTPCDIVDTFPVIVHLSAPSLGLYVNPDVCQGDTVTISLTTANPTITDYVWDFDSAAIITANSNKGGPYKVRWDIAGRHFVTLRAISNASCPASLQADTVDVHPYPDARIGAPVPLNGKSDICIGDSILLGTIAFDNKDHYAWAPEHFFNQTNSDKIFATIGAAGFVTVTVTDPFGCAATGRVMIDAQPCCTVFFPNAFTPGVAGKNALFRPVTTGNHSVHAFRVANRWGQTVFESASENASWDGTYNGVPQDVGVYYYFFTYDCSGNKHQEKGEVMLIR